MVSRPSFWGYTPKTRNAHNFGMETVLLLLERLPDIHRLRWSLSLAEPFTAPHYLGSALRGLMGHGLRKTACVTRHSNCRACALVDHCVYTELFEPAARSDGGHGVPYVLSVPVTSGAFYSKGQGLVFEMTLMSPHQHHLPYLIQAFQRGGRLGLGPKKIGFEVTEVECLNTLGDVDWQTVYQNGKMMAPLTSAAIQPPPAPSSVILTWQTPLRLKRKGQLIGPGRFTATHLLESLLYRACDLLGERPSRLLLDQARKPDLQMKAVLEWQDWSRYSSRQKARMHVGGLMGHVELSGNDLSAWWALLWLSQWLHLGKFTSMGLGGYQLAAASLRDL